jgi:glucose dehydrogenase
MNRRACLAATLTLAASGSLARPQIQAQVQAQAQAPAAAAEWPQFRGNPTLTGLTTAAVPAALKVKWTFEAGDAVESSAAIAGGVAYVGSQKGELLALDVATGKPRWRYKTVEGIGESSPAVSTALGLVFVGDLGGTVHAVRVANGQAAWTFKTKGEIKSSPVVVGDRLVIGSYDGSLYGLDAKAGTQAWTVQTDNYVHGTPAVVDGIAYFAGCDEVFRVVRVSDGKDMGNLPIGAYTGASVAVANGRAYFGTFENEVLAVDLAAKKVAWRYAPKDRQFPFYSSAAIAGGKVILGGRDRSCTPSTPPAARRCGRSRPGPGSNRRRRSPVRASTSARATAASTCSISTPASWCGNTNRARR